MNRYSIKSIQSETILFPAIQVQPFLPKQLLKKKILLYLLDPKRIRERDLF